MWRRPSVWLLVGANLVPVYGVVALAWEVFPLVLLFWLENVVVGAFNVLRLLLASPPSSPKHAAKLFLIPFFVVHYGIFTLVHGAFVFLLFSGGASDPFGGPLTLPRVAAESMTSWQLGWPVLALVASHAFSFVANFLVGGEYRRTPLEKIMMQPYARVVVLHVAILGGGFLVLALGSPAWALFLLVALKIGLDVRAHTREHEVAAPGA